MTNKRTVSNLLALAVLSYLVQRPMHPYELSRTLRANGDDRSIKFTHGSLYMVVGQLHRAGFIAEVATGRTGARPERTVYALTEAGRAEQRAWLRELIEQPRYEYPAFVAALSLIAALPPSQVVPLLRTRVALLTRQRGEIQALIDRALADGVAPLFLVEEDYRLTLLDAELAFLARFRARITGPDGWGRQWAEFHGEPPPADEPAVHERPAGEMGES